ncbi:MAG: hypothetical protein HY347_05935 [candidate division NC10 bacterium]|nr:hypothetical protein [candidate division NC10 bacterium]
MREARNMAKAKPREKIRVVLVSVLALIGLFSFAAYRLFSNIAPPEGVISGTVSLEPSLLKQITFGDVLFIIARQGSGPPLAVKRIPNPSFPLSYTLGPEDRVLTERPFEGEVDVVARITKGGGAGPPQPGDLEGTSPKNPARIGNSHVDIVIDKVY